MSVTTDDIYHQAKLYVGTPYHHEGRLLGIGVDCIGLVVGVHAAAGVNLSDYHSYPMFPPAGLLKTQLEQRSLRRIAFPQAKPGDFASFWITEPGIEVHLGVLSLYGLIHVHAQLGKVVEHCLDKKWSRRLVAVWRSTEVIAGKLVKPWQL